MEGEQTHTFWLGDEPVKYEVRKIKGTDVYNRGVHITRTADTDDNYQQAVLELVYEDNKLVLRQWDGDLDVMKRVALDQIAMRYQPREFNIWRKIWDVALQA